MFRAVMRKVVPDSSDGAVVVSIEDVKKALREINPVLADSRGFMSALVAWMDSELERSGYVKVGRFVIGGVRYHVFLKPGERVPRHVVRLLSRSWRGKALLGLVEPRLPVDYRDVARAVMDRLLRDAGHYVVNVRHPNALKITSRLVNRIISELAVENHDIATWLRHKRVPSISVMQALQDELERAGYTVVKYVNREKHVTLIVYLDKKEKSAGFNVGGDGDSLTSSSSPQSSASPGPGGQ